MDGQTECLSYFGSVTSSGTISCQNNIHTSILNTNCIAGKTLTVSASTSSSKNFNYYMYEKKIGVGATLELLLMSTKKSGSAWTGTGQQTTYTFTVPDTALDTLFTMKGGNNIYTTLYSVKIQ